MDPRVLPHYERELQYLREMGAEFAREFPKIAGRLGIEGLEVADPYVERLLEGFAFLTARLHLKLDAEFPRFTQHLLEILYPHFLAPTPSMAVVQVTPSATEGTLAAGYTIPRGSMMRSQIGRDETTACHYRTAHEVTLWPLELTGAEYGAYLADVAPLLGRISRPARAALRLRLRTTGGLKLSQLALDRLPLFLKSGGELALRLYEQLTARSVGLVVRDPSAREHAGVMFIEGTAKPRGLDDDEALLPFDQRSFQGYRLLQEYFAFPARYLFAELHGLEPALRRCAGAEVEIVVVLDAYDPAIEGAVDATHLALHCTPAINIFARRADRIHLTDHEHEYHVVPDRTRPLDFEVWSVTDVRGFGTANEAACVFRPLYARPESEQGPSHTAAYYTVNRQPRLLSAKQKLNGPRSSYVGTEVFVSLVDGHEGPYRSGLKQLAVETLCTNRDLPLHMSLGLGDTDFNLESAAPASSVRVVAGPTAPAMSHAQGSTAWHLIGQLGLDYLSLLSGPGPQAAASIRELLSLYADLTNSAIRRQIDGVQSVDARGITRRLPVTGPPTFARGLEVTLGVDETAFEPSGAYLLATVLERFFGKYVTINSFVETVLKTLQRGEVRRWTPRLGQQPAL